MANEGGEWIMHGMDWDDPFRIRTWRELINYINQVGFLPLFANEVPGFSVEDHVANLFWLPCMQEKGPGDLFIAGQMIRNRIHGNGGRSLPIRARWLTVSSLIARQALYH